MFDSKFLSTSRCGVLKRVCFDHCQYVMLRVCFNHLLRLNLGLLCDVFSNDFLDTSNRFSLGSHTKKLPKMAQPITATSEHFESCNKKRGLFLLSFPSLFGWGESFWIETKKTRQTSFPPVLLKPVATIDQAKKTNQSKRQMMPKTCNVWSDSSTASSF